jgi:UDP-N-acetylmuramoyl-tripeptide--D-alanyl-D-alanine ligase
MRLAAEHKSAVIEMGANRLGDVAELVGLVSPNVGLITNAGAEHLEGFGDLDGVARGEGEMVEGLGQDAAAVINADDPYAGYWRKVARSARILTFGVRAAADFSAAGIAQSIEHGEFQTRFVLKCPLGEHAVSLKAGGSHNVLNALGAAAAASAAGASLEDIAAGLADFRAVAGRLQLKAGLRDSWIIDDSYNANPSSVRAGLDVLRSLEGPKWLVLADMAELGAHTSDSHADLGRYARDCGVLRLFAFGPESSRAVETFGSGGEWFQDVQPLIGRLQQEISPGIAVLVKGSRVNRLERVVQALLAAPAEADSTKRAS